MVGSTAVPRDRRELARHPATWILVVGVGACVAVAIAQIPTDRPGKTPLAIVLTVAAVVAGFAVVPTEGQASISGGFIVMLLAAGLLGPSAACACAMLVELAATARLRTPFYPVVSNLFGVLL